MCVFSIILIIMYTRSFGHTGCPTSEGTAIVLTPQRCWGRIGVLAKPGWSLEAEEAALLSARQGADARSYQGSEQLPLMFVQTLRGVLLQGVLFAQLLEKALLP